MTSIDEKEKILRRIYNNLGILEYYNEDGGFGFEVVEERNNYQVLIFDEAYEIVREARKLTDSSGIEYPFILFGRFYKDGDDDYFVCTEGMLDKGDLNNGHCENSSEFINSVNKKINEERFDFIIRCHTHPDYRMVDFKLLDGEIDRSNSDALKLRDIGMNMSFTDLRSFVSSKINQERYGNRLISIYAISLPNGEFNILDINDLKGNTKLVSVPDVFRIENDNIIPVNNIWTSKQSEKKINSNVE